MTLNKALKHKNRIVGELNRLKTIFSRENSRATPTTSTVNCEDVLSQILALTQALTDIKAKIALANINIYAHIERISQTKALITYLQSLNTTNGLVKSAGHYGAQPVETHYTAFLTQEKVDQMVRNCQTEIEKLQDEVDEYNAGTKIAD